jgi:hypothetical protein
MRNITTVFNRPTWGRHLRKTSLRLVIIDISIAVVNYKDNLAPTSRGQTKGWSMKYEVWNYPTYKRMGHEDWKKLIFCSNVARHKPSSYFHWSSACGKPYVRHISLYPVSQKNSICDRLLKKCVVLYGR